MAQAKKTAAKKRKDNKVAAIVAVIAIALVAVIGASYAFFTQTFTGTATDTITAGQLNVTLSGNTDVNIQKAFPVTKSYALQEYDPFTFTITNEGSVDASVDVSLTPQSGNTIGTQYIRYALYEGTDAEHGTLVTAAPFPASGDLTVATGLRLDNHGYKDGANENDPQAASAKTYALYLWIDKDATMEQVQNNQTFAAKVSIDAIQADGRLNADQEGE